MFLFWQWPNGGPEGSRTEGVLLSWSRYRKWRKTFQRVNFVSLWLVKKCKLFRLHLNSLCTKFWQKFNFFFENEREKWFERHWFPSLKLFKNFLIRQFRIISFFVCTYLIKINLAEAFFLAYLPQIVVVGYLFKLKYILYFILYVANTKIWWVVFKPTILFFSFVSLMSSAHITFAIHDGGWKIHLLFTLFTNSDFFPEAFPPQNSAS